MALSEIRVNTTKTRTGVGTITYTETGPVITGIATASNFKTGSTNVHSTGVELANINTGGSTATFGGAISGTSATLSGALSGTTASFSGTVSIGGTLTYEDVTNIDSVGIVTARAGVKVTGGNLEIGTSVGRFDSSGIIKTAHGTESAPSHTFINDNDNGMYRPTTNTLGFVCGGDEKVRITSAGNIIPGTNNATNIGDGSTNFHSIWASTRFRGNDNVKLILGNAQDLVIRHDGTNNIIGSPVGGDLHIKSGTLDNDNQLIAAFKHSNGSVGIGTDNPDTKLEVWSTGNNSSVLKLSPGTTAGNYGGIELGRTDGGGTVRMTTVVKGGVPISGIAGIEFGSSDTNLPAVSLASANSSNGHIVFKPKQTEKVRIKSDGSVRMGGSTASAYSAHVNVDDLVVGGTSSHGITILTGNSATGSLWFDSENSNRGFIQYAHNEEALILGTEGDERLRITSGGNVDINGTPPWSVAGGDYRNLSISGQIANAGGFLWLGNGTATTNGDFDLGRINFCNGATITSQIAGSTQTSANDDGRFSFWTKPTGGNLTERLRIHSSGKVVIGTGNRNAETSTGALLIDRDITAESDAGDPTKYHLVIRSQSNSNTSKLGIGFVNTTDDDKIGAAILHHRTGGGSVGELGFYTSPSDGTTTERLRITSVGINVWGNSNTFYGGGSGSNLNGDIRIRSTGSAVYQNLFFTSSDGTNTGSIVGYYGGSVMFFNSTSYVWSINSQGERLELTNTALSPRATSTVLDLGTTTKRYRRTHTDAITVNTENTNTKFCINGGSSANVMTIRNTTGGNGNVGILFSTQDHSGGREKAAIYHQDTHGGAHYGGDFIFCLNGATGSAGQVGTSDERMRITRHGELKTKNRGDQKWGLTIADEYGVWGSNTGLAPNTSRTWTITSSSYGWGRFCIGGGDGNYQRAACIIDYGGVMWATAKSYYHNEIVKSSSGASISTTYNNGSIVVTVTAGSNWWYYTVNLIQGRRDASSWATITQS